MESHAEREPSWGVGGNWELLCSVGIAQDKHTGFAPLGTSLLFLGERANERAAEVERDDVTGSRLTGSRICVALTHLARPPRHRAGQSNNVLTEINDCWATPPCTLY